jgi:hypothetical protein
MNDYDDAYVHGEINELSFPKYIGSLEIYDLHVQMTKRPSKWCQWWMKVLLGWIWRDN